MSRALLDTNIIIHRENIKPTNYSIGQLFYWLDKLNYEKVIHPLTITELQKFKDSNMQSLYKAKLSAYTVMKNIACQTTDFKDTLADLPKSENDAIDNQLLCEVYLGRVDILITEDRKMIAKAEKLSLADKVFSINSFISKCINENPELIDYKCIQKYQEASVFLNRNEIPFVPEDFHVIEKKSGEPVFSLFQKLESVLYLLYIANTSYFAENKLVIQLKIDLGMDIELHDFQFNEKIQEIGSWIFSGDNAVERAGIARNILAEKCKTSSDLLNISQDTINSIKSNFVIYQRDTTEQYIETKNRIADNIVELSRQQEEMVQDIVDGLRNNLIAIVTFLITVILAGVDMDKMLQGDSLPYNVRFVTIILIIGSIVYLIASIIGTYFKLKSLERGYNHLKEHYKTLLVADDVNTTFDSTYDETVQRVKKYQNIIACIWGAFIIVMIVVYVWFAHPEVVKWISEFFCKSRQVQKK